MSTIIKVLKKKIDTDRLTTNLFVRTSFVLILNETLKIKLNGESYSNYFIFNYQTYLKNDGIKSDLY